MILDMKESLAAARIYYIITIDITLIRAVLLYFRATVMYDLKKNPV